ncbi:lipase secretion chaperone [Alcanivoracaceae bacterium MT1]
MTKGLVIAVAMILVIWWWRAERTGPPLVTPLPIPTQTTEPPPQKEAGFEGYARRGRALSSTLPRSWRGTEPDGTLTEDGTGNLMVDEGLRRRFDYFLSALGEEDLETLKARLAADFQSHLSAPAAAQAWALLERYLDYNEALAELTAPEQTSEDLRQGLEQRRAVRARFFDAAISEALFGAEDRYTDFTLERRRLLEDETLDDSTRQQRLEALEAALPAELRQQVTAPHEPMAVNREVERMREAGASAGEIDRLRDARLGRKAADRLAELDQRRERWRNRYQDYSRQRQAILDSGLGGPDQQEEIRRLRERLFEATEQSRVEALDQLQDPPP